LQVQDEQSLVKRAQQKDEEAFARLYEEYFDRIYRYLVLKIGSELEAEDMTQQVFLSALESIGSYRWQGLPFSAWLYRIAHNKMVDHVRKATKHEFVPLDEALTVASGNPQAEAEHKLEMDRLLVAMEKLTAAQRECVSLRFTSDLSIAEVAKTMGKSEGAIKALQHSAVLALRKILVEGHEG
jgi:RNA polymerase sigma-70 factor, ECF subfamily